MRAASRPGCGWARPPASPARRCSRPTQSSPARAAVDSYVDFCRDRPWPEAVASSLTELFAPALVQSRLTAIQEHYPWVKPEGLGYFRNRLVQAPRDVEHGLQLVLEHAPTRQDQDTG